MSVEKDNLYNVSSHKMKAYLKSFVMESHIPSAVDNTVHDLLHVNQTYSPQMIRNLYAVANTNNTHQFVHHGTEQIL